MSGKKILLSHSRHAPKSRAKKNSSVSVVFSSGGRRYDYLCDMPLKAGDSVIVETETGETIVTVTAVFEKSESELAFPLKTYKKILRKAD